MCIRDRGDTQWIYAENQNQRSPYFRTEQKLDSSKKVANASLYITSLGVYDAYINGQQVMMQDAEGNPIDDTLAPGWTDYNSYIYYQGYDVTSYVQDQEDIALGVQLGLSLIHIYVFFWNLFVYAGDFNIPISMECEFWYKSFSAFCTFHRIAVCTQCGSIAVSYTHLDVYKRQC